MNPYPCSGCGSRFCDGECFVEDRPENEEIKKMLLSPDTQDTEELILRAESRLDYYSGHRSQFITNAETIVKKDDLRALIALARPRPDSPVTVMREALEQAKAHLGAGFGDHPNEAIRQSNINRAWHLLGEALARISRWP